MTDPSAQEPSREPVESQWCEFGPRDELNPWSMVAVMVLFMVGIVLLLTLHWRRGSVMIGGSLVLAGFLRWFLPSRFVGLLRVRGAVFDIALMLILGVAIMALGMLVPGTYGA